MASDEKFGVLIAMDVAAKLVRQAGFEHVSTSPKSISCYFRLPGVNGLLRLSDHGHQHSRAHERVLSSLSFRNPSGLWSLEMVERETATAIGYYVLRAGMVVRSQGEQVRWTVRKDSEPALA